METVLDVNKMRAIELIAQGLKMHEIAKQVGVCARTIQNWKHDQQFATELHKHISHMRDAREAAFLPMLDQIQALSGKFLKRIESMIDAADDKLALAGMLLYLQCLKWAGSRDNQGRGSMIGTDGMVGKYDGYPGAENLGNLAKLFSRPGWHPEVAELVAAQEESETGNANVAQASSLRVPETTDQETSPAPISAAPTSEAIQTAETGKERKPESLPQVMQSAATQTTSTNSPAGSRRDKKPWLGKGSNHVPFYKKFMKR